MPVRGGAAGSAAGRSALGLDERVDLAAVAAVDLSTARDKAARSPELYTASIDSRSAMTFACALALGDQCRLNRVNTCLHELLVGEDFRLYQETFQRAFGIEPLPPEAGFPAEFR